MVCHGWPPGLPTHCSTLVTAHALFLWLVQGLDAFSQSGLYSNHADIGPRWVLGAAGGGGWVQAAFPWADLESGAGQLQSTAQRHSACLLNCSVPPPTPRDRYAGVLLGLSNTAGVLAGVLGTAATGFILQNGSWNQVGAGAGWWWGWCWAERQRSAVAGSTHLAHPFSPT